MHEVFKGLRLTRSMLHSPVCINSFAFTQVASSHCIAKNTHGASANMTIVCTC